MAETASRSNGVGYASPLAAELAEDVLTRFLRYVVEHSANSRDELLKERSIGVEVFGRAPDYDTAEDPEGHRWMFGQPLVSPG